MKKLDQKTHDGGFTIIEVVLVLAIAALIFLIVFLALPALQRSQRDTARKNDVSRFISQLTNYQSNNQGAIPANTGWAGFVSSYMTVGGQSFADPQTGSYTLNVLASTATAPTSTIGTVNIYPGGVCDSDLTNGVTAGSARQVAIVMPVEQGGFYCQNN
ncbi:MAG: type II secretion system protein [Candidatus Woesebacteria bacterium]|jgi:prepilin-type N-terminal cleavage/methylation domain-containing protein